MHELNCTEDEVHLGSREQYGEDGKFKLRFGNVIDPPVVAILIDDDDVDTCKFIIVVLKLEGVCCQLLGFELQRVVR